MAHHRKVLAGALALNTAIVVTEIAAGREAGSLDLVMDAMPNLSDELALIALYLAFVLPQGVSRGLDLVVGRARVRRVARRARLAGEARLRAR